MTNSLSSALAHAIADDRLRTARERRSRGSTAGLVRPRVALGPVSRYLPRGAVRPQVGSAAS
jgi:hypothetical protein